jgi:hypothetical protein
MNSKTDKYTELIERIKATQAKISDPQKLTLKTMHSIELSLQKKSNNKTLSIVSWASSIAASLLIGLFVFEQLTAPTEMAFTSSKIMPVYISEDNNMEKPTTINDFKQLLNNKIERQKKQQNFNSIINKYKNI